MKKTLIASAIALNIIAGTNANADIAVTNMDFSEVSTATGTITDSGAFGAFESTQAFFGSDWFATQETGVITNSNGATWVGSNSNGAWDYSSDIALMTDNQVAVGVLWDWNAANDTPVLAVFDCITTPGVCTGQTVGAGGVRFGGLQLAPFGGELIAFNGTGNLSAVPVPATVWLMGSGLLGLVSIASRRKIV